MKRKLIIAACSLMLSASSAYGQSTQSQPVESQPVESQPVESQPVESQPVPSQESAGESPVLPNMTKPLESPKAGPHGGSVKQARNLQIETIVSQAGLQMFIYDRAGQPVSISRGRGAVSVRSQGNAKRYRYDLLPNGKGALTAPVNLSQLAGRQIEISVKLVGISASTISLSEVTTVPLSPQQLEAAAIARQKICPISGKPLGSMGAPVAVDMNKQKIYVCCAGCVEALKENPTRYATGRPQIVITTSTQADASRIAAQKVCPVMDGPLGGMGTPIKAMVGDKPIYLCCKGCIRRLKAEPAKYLAMVYGVKE